MLTIRNNTFETNSSSTHSIVIGTEDQFNQWSNGQVFYKSYAWSSDTLKQGFYTKEELIEDYVNKGDYTREELINMDEDEFIYLLNEDDIYDRDGWRSYLEHDVTTYTTPGGEKIIIECAYGYDG